MYSAALLPQPKKTLIITIMAKMKINMQIAFAICHHRSSHFNPSNHRSLTQTAVHRNSLLHTQTQHHVLPVAVILWNSLALTANRRHSPTSSLLILHKPHVSPLFRTHTRMPPFNSLIIIHHRPSCIANTRHLSERKTI